MSGDRPVLRRRAWWCVVLLGCLAAVVPSPASARSHRPSLPDRFAPLSTWTRTATVRQRPAGRAIALLRYCSDDTSQATVVGADRDSYRRLTLSRFDEEASTGLIAPDGTRVLLLDSVNAPGDRRGARLVDLRTGAVRHVRLTRWHSNVGAGPQLLAWSYDGRYVAYAVPAPPPADGTAAGSYEDGRPIRDLVLLDLRTGVSTRYPKIRPVRAAAFAPDGRLAAQVRQQALLVTTHGVVRGRIALPAGQELAGPAAWSPDGALLATTAATGAGSTSAVGVGFVRAPGAHRPVPEPVAAGSLLGWRGADRVLVARDLRIDEVSLTDRRIRTANRWPVHDAPICDLHLAIGLVRQATIRSATEPDRGATPLWPLAAAGAVALALAVLATVLLLRRRRRLLRSRR
ncbi:hypothetical protein [Actinocatenispora sera]|uniref:hypothetical protein n=1 Tax=Actinocatenispora sera TaxID=390989 RepID=UPI0012ED56A6|nr:hypothetical protein [Actinocatenispora sera]